MLRLLESAKVQGLRIPRQSRLIAVAKIEGNHMHLLIKSIEVDGHIIAVKLSAYDMDGQEGVYIPGSEDINAFKEVGANIGGSMGTSFTFGFLCQGPDYLRGSPWGDAGCKSATSEEAAYYQGNAQGWLSTFLGSVQIKQSKMISKK